MSTLLAARPADSPAPPPTSSGHNLRAIMGERGFRRLLGTRVLAQLSDGLFQAGLAGSVLFNPDKRASALAVAAGFAVVLLPYSLIGPNLGVFIDRWSRRSIVFVSNMLRAALVLPAAALIWWGADGPPFLVLTLAIIGLGRFFLAAMSAATPHVVDDDRLVTANALASTLGTIAFSVGLGSVAVMVWVGVPASFHGYAVIAALAPLGYAASALLTRVSFDETALGPDAVQRRREPALAAARHVLRGMFEGVRHLAGQRNAAYALLAQAAHRVLFGVLALMTLVLYRNAFAPESALGSDDIEGSIGRLGQAFVAGACGTLIAAFVTPPLARRFGGWRWITALLGLAAVAVLAFGLPFDPRLMPLAVGVLAAVSQGTKIVVDTSLQHECADDFRGRVFSVNDTAFNLCFVVGSYIAALTLPSDGRSPTAIITVAAGYALVTAWYAVVSARAGRASG